MRPTRRPVAGRVRLSLRSRLLTVFIVITAVFLIVMGVVTAVVLGNIEQDQFNTDLALTAKSSPEEIENTTGDYVAADVARSTGTVTLLTSPSRDGTALRDWLAGLIAQGRAYAYLRANVGRVFDVRCPTGRPSPRS